MESFFTSNYSSPIGNLPLVAHENALIAVLWENDSPNRVNLPAQLIEQETRILTETKKQLDAYFEGKRKIFDLPIQTEGTDFQVKIWKALTEIPFGQTRTYGQLAKEINQTSASRAVGAANGRNPISIIIPCHRVIGTNGKLTGFAGGLEAKQYLLKLEGSLLF
jgi:methylated-DNA-[protein]-cysteine S-methyltransferase